MAAEADRMRKIDTSEINIPAGPRLGDIVLEADKWGRASSAAPSCTTCPAVARLGIVGVIRPNGVGKTTLFRMITGEEKPDTGDQVGQTVKIPTTDQSRGGIDPNKNVWEVVSDGLDFIKVANFEMNSRAYVASFGFKGPDEQKKAGVLSGGERNRLNLGVMLKMRADAAPRRAHQRPRRRDPVLAQGRAARLPRLCRRVPHDRCSDRVATHILAWEGDAEDPANWFWFEGNYAAYEENKIKRLGIEAGPPAPGSRTAASPATEPAAGREGTERPAWAQVGAGLRPPDAALPDEVRSGDPGPKTRPTAAKSLAGTRSRMVASYGSLDAARRRAHQQVVSPLLAPWSRPPRRARPRASCCAGDVARHRLPS